jgi:prephenate dehydrogenase
MLVAGLGARPHVLAPDHHDAAVASISHLPLLAATSVFLAAARMPRWLEARTLAAGGFRDTTRVASGDPRMARDICLTNTESILEALDAYLATLHEFRALLAARDPAIEEVFAHARALRDAWLADA